MTDPTKKTDATSPDPASGADADLDDAQGEEAPSERPTVVPPFDVAAYAQVVAAPSVEPPPELEWVEEDADTADTVPPSDEPTLPPEAPPPLPILGVEGPHAPPDSAAVLPPTKRSVSLTEGGLAADAGGTRSPSSSPPLSQRITPPEVARVEAAPTLPREEPPDVAGRPGAPRSGLSSDSLLSLANRRAPRTAPPQGVLVVEPPLAASTPTSARRAPEPAAVADPVGEMNERFALGDYSGALAIAESMLEANPTHPEAREYAESCRTVLLQMYTARIGPLCRVPVVAVARDQLRWLSIDHKSGFILSLVDGVSSLEMILDICGMPTLDALRMLYELVQQRVVTIRDD